MTPKITTDNGRNPYYEGNFGPEEDADSAQRRAAAATRDLLLKTIDETACMLRGMTMDPAIPKHAKEAMRSKVTELEALVEAHADV